jgi:hypothetical protein
MIPLELKLALGDVYVLAWDVGHEFRGIKLIATNNSLRVDAPKIGIDTENGRRGISESLKLWMIAITFGFFL